jgi:catabolite regulation protein CreA
MVRVDKGLFLETASLMNGCGDGKMRALGAAIAYILIVGCGDKQVDAFYYPDRLDLTVHVAKYDVGSVEECRDWVYSRAAERGDPDMERGDYECGVDPIRQVGDLTVYKETVR